MPDDEVSENDGELSVAVESAPEGVYLIGDTVTASTVVRDPLIRVIPAPSKHSGGAATGGSATRGAVSGSLSPRNRWLRFSFAPTTQMHSV